MSYKSSYSKGDWKAVCDSCGREFKASELRKRWDGLMVCSVDYETRHPQDFVRGVLDTQVVPWNRSAVQDTFIFSSPSSIAGLAVAGSMIAGNTNNPGLVPASTFG